MNSNTLLILPMALSVLLSLSYYTGNYTHFIGVTEEQHNCKLVDLHETLSTSRKLIVVSDGRRS